MAKHFNIDVHGGFSVECEQGEIGEAIDALLKRLQIVSPDLLLEIDEVWDENEEIASNW